MAKQPPTRIVTTYQQGIGFVAEVFGRRGEVLHTTALCRTKLDAFTAAKEWLKKRKDQVKK